jgi:multimeric flavodoxin WrbA
MVNLSKKNVDFLKKELKGKKSLIIATSSRWDGHQDDIPKSTELAMDIANSSGAVFIDASKLNIFICEGNVSSSSGNNCGIKEALLKNKEKNPSGNHRCWASINNKTDELWIISKALFEADIVLFFASVRWGQTNSVYQKLIERLTWLENRHTTYSENNLLEGKKAGIILFSHNWRSEEVLDTQIKVLSFFGFDTPKNLSFKYQWTKDYLDETQKGYKKDHKDFLEIFKITKRIVKRFIDWINPKEKKFS